jgi:chromosomal replication initiator protein
VLTFSTISHQPITLSMARRALSDHITRTKRCLGLDEIDQTVATYFGLTPADLHTSRKTRTIALARGIAMYLARKHTDMSFPEIGRFMGNKNHSTVILATRKIQQMLDGDAVVVRQTPAGLKEERLREIAQQLEEQLGKAVSGVSVRAEMLGLALLESPARSPAPLPATPTPDRAAV